jgi:hypothetical protein
MRIAKLLATVAILGALSGCDVDPPGFISGNASTLEHGRIVRQWDLTPQNVAQVRAWLVQHRTGWSSDLNSYAPRTRILFKTEDGSTWDVNVFPTVVVVNGGGRQFKQSFPPDDVKLLLEAAGGEPA